MTGIAAPAPGLGAAATGACESAGGNSCGVALRRGALPRRVRLSSSAGFSNWPADVSILAGMLVLSAQQQASRKISDESQCMWLDFSTQASKTEPDMPNVTVNARVCILIKQKF